jgi:hypothetical protein
MPARKQFQTSLQISPNLQKLLKQAKDREVSEDELHEQRVSFAFGNAPANSRITKETVRHASQHIRLKRR